MDTHETPPPVRRLCVLGTSGSGKSYVAIEAARRLGLRYISNDALIWGPHWQPAPREVRPTLFDVATRDEDSRGWTFDGNVTGADPEDRIVLDRCDTLVWLDLPRRQVWPQVLWRTLHRVVTREPLWHGNVETWRMLLSRDSVVLWSLRTFARRRRTFRAMFADPRHADRARIRLTSRRAVNAWLASLGEPRG